VLAEDCGATAIPVLGGACVPVGPQDCGAGFVRRADGGCEPVLDECGEDEIPRLGGGCVSVGDTQGCGEGTFGDIPDEPGTVHVDPSYEGSDPDGSRARPFRDIEAALTATPPGGTVALAAGRYTRYPAIARPLKLRGRCADMVELAGTVRVTIPGYVPDLPARFHVADATGVLVDGVRVTQGGALGIVVSGSNDVTIRQVRIAHVGPFGALVHGSRGVVIEQTRVSQTYRAAIHSKHSAEVTVRRCLVEDTRESDGKWGWGLNFEGRIDATNLAEENLVRRCRDRGIRLAYTSGVLRGNLVADVTPGTESTQPAGIYVQESASALVEDNIVDRATFIAVVVSRASPQEIAASDVRLVGNLVRDTALPAGQPACASLWARLDSGVDRLEVRRNVVTGLACYGMQFQGPLSVAAVEDNSIIGARAVGIATVDTPVTVRRNLVSDVVDDPAQPGGAGIVVRRQEAEGAPAPPVIVSGNLVRRVAGGGIGCALVTGEVDSNWIHDTVPPSDPADGAFGLLVRACDDIVVRGNALFRNSVNSIWFSRSTGLVDGNVVVDTQATAPLVDDTGVEWFVGQALAVFASPEFSATRNVLRGSTMEGLVVYASAGTVEGNVVEDVAPGAPSNAGFGIACFADAERPGAVTVRGNTVLRASAAGISAGGVSGTIEGNAVLDTRAGEVEGADGTRETVADGIELFDAAMDVSGCYVEGTARAGIAAVALAGAIAGNLVRDATVGVRFDGEPLASIGPNACCAVHELCVEAGEGLIVQSRLPLPPLPE
jgi:hypothetical protein